MLCQNCKRNDARVHVKRIINGESAEINLCSSCAAALGVADTFTGAGSLGDMLGSFFTPSDTVSVSNRVLRCETCGFSFEDIARTGRPGCPECYRVFSRKLAPTIVKLHGRAVYRGKQPSGEKTESKPAQRAEELKKKLDEAIAQENYELAAVLRDEIRAIMGKENG